MYNKYKDIKLKWLEEKGFNVYEDDKQLAYVQDLFSPPSEVQGVFCDSRAGTGKSSLAVLAGVYGVEKEEYKKIIYIRNAVPIRDLGFLPGDLGDKELPFMGPLIDSMDNVQPSLFYDWNVEDGKGVKKVEATTSSHIRGLTYNDAFVIVDEAQNWELGELQTLYTRCTDTCKIVTIGCTRQIDNRKLEYVKGLTPFEVFMKHFSQGDPTCKIHKLERNYRGLFSNKADEIQDTLKKLVGE